MVKQAQIPILTRQSFPQSYYKHSAKPALISESNLYFDVQRKCIWKDEVQPNRLDFYMVFLVLDGEGVHTLGTKEQRVEKNTLCFVGPTMINSWKALSRNHKGYFCVFSEAFAVAGSANKHLLQDFPFFQIDANPVLHLTEDQSKYYQTLFEFMLQESEHRSAYSDAVLRSQLMVILNNANAHHRLQHDAMHESKNAGPRLLKLFKAAYLRDFDAIREGKDISIKRVSAYAEELGVSQNHLNDTVKSLTGRSAGQLIKDQLTRQATMCLMHSNKSISEISYRLGFSDPSYFARFYKSQCGVTPSEVRQGHNL